MRGEHGEGGWDVDMNLLPHDNPRLRSRPNQAYRDGASRTQLEYLDGKHRSGNVVRVVADLTPVRFVGRPLLGECSCRGWVKG